MEREVGKLNLSEVYQLLTGAIAPRPIFLVSTITKDGTPNLAPFSFSNVFSISPPIIGFSVLIGMRDGAIKDTQLNLELTPECTVQIVTEDILYRSNITAIRFDYNEDEFVKSGFTPVPSKLVKPPLVKEASFKMECRVKDLIPLGRNNGSGILVLCEVLVFHIEERIVKNGAIDGHLLKAVGRNGADTYTKAYEQSLFDLPIPTNKEIIGYDKMLEFNWLHKLKLTSEEISKLAIYHRFPDFITIYSFIEKSCDTDFENNPYAKIFFKLAKLNDGDSAIFDFLLKEVLKLNQIELAWMILGYRLTLDTKETYDI